MGPSGPVALDMLAIHQGMLDYGVDQDERVEFSFMVRKIASLVFSAQAEEANNKRKLNTKH